MKIEEIVKRKKDGQELKAEEIDSLVEGYASGRIADEEMSVFLDSVTASGFSQTESIGFAQALVRNSTSADLTGMREAKIGLYTTGFTGPFGRGIERTALIAGPVLSSMGVRAPMLLRSHDGVREKLSALNGFRTAPGVEQYVSGMADVWINMIKAKVCSPVIGKIDDLIINRPGRSGAAVEAALVAASARVSGADGLVVDVQTGPGSMFTDRAGALDFAGLLNNLCQKLGMKAAALVTDISQPVGRCMGPELELKEVLMYLKGGAQKAQPEDLHNLCLNLSVWMLNAADSISEEEAVRTIDPMTKRRYWHEALEFVERGDAFKKLVELVDSSGGDPEILFSISALKPADVAGDLSLDTGGYIVRLDTEVVARAACVLVGEPGSPEYDPSAGLMLLKKSGDEVDKGLPVAMLYAPDDGRLQEAKKILRTAYETGPRKPADKPLVLEVVF